MHSSVNLYDGCASILVKKLSNYDLSRIQNSSESSLKFLEITDDDLKEIPVIKKLIEDIGNRVEYNDHSYATVPSEEIEAYRKYLSDKYEEQYEIKPDFKEYGDPYFFYNDKTYWINLGGYSSEYVPTREMVIEIQKNPQEKSIILTDEDLLFLPKIKKSINDIGKFESSSYNYTGIPESKWQQYIDYFEQKSTEQFGNDSSTTMFQYKYNHYDVGFAIC